MFIAALFIVARKLEETKISFKMRTAKAFWYIHTLKKVVNDEKVTTYR